MNQMSRLMGKPTICIGENKDTKLISAFVFATPVVQFLFYLNPKFQASSSFLLLCRLVCVRPVRKPHCWFSHEMAQILLSFVKAFKFSILLLVVTGSSGKQLCAIYTPRNPTFIQQNLGYAGAHLFILFLLQNIDCGYSPRRF